MKDTVVVVTACDDNYRPFLAGWLSGVARQKTIYKVNVVVIDVGLNPGTIDLLTALDVSVIGIPSTIPVPSDIAVEIRSVLIRPYLPEMVPDSKYIIWADCDLWFQTTDVIQSYCDAAEYSDVALTAEVDRNYPSGAPLDLQKQGRYEDENLSADTSEILYNWYSVHFPQGFAKFLSRNVLVNTGILCARRQSPMWDAWAGSLQERLAYRGKDFYQHAQQKSADFMIELLSFNAAMRLGRWTTTLLPAVYNWMCHLSLPWQEKDGSFREPSYPFDEIKVVHMTSVTKWNDYEIRQIGSDETRTCKLRSPQSLAI